jgi:hypothetical protein
MDKQLSEYLTTLEQEIANLKNSISNSNSPELIECYSANLSSYLDSMLVSKTIFSPSDTPLDLTKKVRECKNALNERARAQPLWSFERTGYRNVLTFLEENLREYL